MYISLKFRIFAISFQQLPHSVIDWGTIKNILLSYKNNARNIYNTVLVSSFVYNQALLAFISRRLWCSIRYLTLAFCSRVFCHTIHNSLRSGITAGIMELRIYGITEIGLRVATPDYEGRNYGITDRAKPNIATLCCAGQQDDESTRQQVKRQQPKALYALLYFLYLLITTDCFVSTFLQCNTTQNKQLFFYKIDTIDYLVYTIIPFGKGRIKYLTRSIVFFRIIYDISLVCFI